MAKRVQGHALLETQFQPCRFESSPNHIDMDRPSSSARKLSPAATEGTTFASITGYQEPTRWRGDRARRCPLAGG
jgi:hypothetical protein